MKKIQMTTLFFIPILTLILFIFWMQYDAKKSIKIEPIQIQTLNIREENPPTKVLMQEDPSTILSKLKIAISTSTEAIITTKEEIPNKVLHTLKKQISKQEVEKTLIKQEVNTPQKIVINNALIPKETKNKFTTKIQNSKAKKDNNKKNKMFKKELKKTTKLSREEEVTLYKDKYSTGLEVISISENFEIKEENTLPDSYYFEPIETIKPIENNSPLEFVKKLGVVSISNKYESNFSIPQKIELAKEGIVNISSSTIETQEIKNLEFVNTLEVIEVSEDFETIEAINYLD